MNTTHRRKAPSSAHRRPLRLLLIRFAAAIGAIAMIGLTGLLAGCEPVSSGSEGTLYFSYVANDMLVIPNLSTPTAVGATAQVEVFRDADGEQPILVTSAMSSDPAVLEVQQIDSSRITVSAVGAGTATIMVNSDIGSDGIDITVDEPATWVLTAPSTLSELNAPVVLEGGTVRAGVRMLNDNNRQLTGYGLTPFEIAPSGAAEILETTDMAHITIEVLDPGPITISPPSGEALTLQTASPDDVESLAIEGSDSALAPDQESLIIIKANLPNDAQAIGLRGLAQVSGTEGICTVEASDALPNVNDAWDLRAEAPGDCEVTVQLGELMTSRVFTIE